MAWIESHAELRDHPKTDLLMELLGVTRRDAVGLIHFVWWRALTYAPTGDLTAFTDGQVARWADWDGSPADLIAGLTIAGFLDDGRQLHDWQEYAGRWIDRREANATRKREARAARSNRTSPGRREDVPQMSGATGPNRTLTGPDRTGPDPYPNLSATGRKGFMAAGAAGISSDAKAALSALPGGLPAGAFQDAAEAALTALGFAVQREVRVPDRGDGRPGRIDLVAERNGERLAIELDRASPRDGSVRKLVTVEDATKVVVVREPFAGPTPPGIDAVISPKAAPKRAEAKPVLNGRNGWAGCPAGCPTNHGGPIEARLLGDARLAIPADDRPAWPDYLRQHGRPDLANDPAPTPATQEA